MQRDRITRKNSGPSVTRKALLPLLAAIAITATVMIAISRGSLPPQIMETRIGRVMHALATVILGASGLTLALFAKAYLYGPSLHQNQNNKKERFLLGLLLMALILVLAVITSFLTGFMIIGKDMAEIDTVGVIAHQGFPVWFAAVAPGISTMSSWRPERFVLNTLIWTAAYLIGANAIRRKMRSKKDTESSNQRLEATGETPAPQP